MQEVKDLISRQAVMELIESKCTNGCLGTADTTLIDAYGLIDEVSDMPVAYNVEKVIEQEHAYLMKITQPHTKLYRNIMDIIRNGGKE